MQKNDSRNLLQGDPLWYKDAILYELHVRAFSDSNADGMGDFRGLAEKLDYLEELGVTAIWVLPFSPSPWRDDGYDIADFRGVHAAYGTLRDFQIFLREAHRRGIRVITELVLNHTSDQHEWFQRSRRAAPGSRWRDFYVWSDTPEKYTDTRIIFKDFETSNWTWDPVAKAYFWHRFYSHQPDLNFDNPLVRRAVMRILDFWCELGVDGFRLDAIPYLFEREGTTCENLPETHEFLKELRSHIDERYPNRMFLAEANMWPEDAIAYFQEGRECHMAFHFPLMPRLFMALRLEDRFPIVEILRRTPAIPENCQWALFLRNHDELTLEMVTDEERDYMYRVYAADQRSRINLGIRRRLAPLLGNDRPRIELMNGLLFSLPGTPVIYYGDEIGMGDNVYLGDRNGVRTPMQWSPDRNAGFSSANPQRLYLPVNIDPAYHYESINVESQQGNPHSLLSWTKRLVALRKQYKAFGRGTLEFLHPTNQRILAFIRRYEQETILVVVNLSRFAQPAQLDLKEFAGMTPMEMFGRTDFPIISDAPYALALGPNSFYWFSLEAGHITMEEKPTQDEAEPVAQIPMLSMSTVNAIWQSSNRDLVASAIAAFLVRRGLLRTHRRVRASEIIDVLPLQHMRFYIVLVRLDFNEGDPQIVHISVGIERDDTAKPPEYDSVIARLRFTQDDTARLIDASGDAICNQLLLDIVARRKRLQGEVGTLTGQHNRILRKALEGENSFEAVSEQAGTVGTSVRFGNRVVMKLLRSVETGENPGVTLGRLLTEVYSFPNTAPFAGSLDYQQKSGGNITVGILHGFVPHDMSAWSLALNSLSAFFDHAKRLGPKQISELQAHLPPNVYSLDTALEPRREEPSFIGDFLTQAGEMGTRLGELHRVLARPSADPAIEPELYDDFYRQSLYHSMLRLLSLRFEFLRKHYSELPEDSREMVDPLIACEEALIARFSLLSSLRIQATRTRYHGHLGLENLLHSGNDFVFIDFEGDPATHLSERSIKRTPLRDLASLLHSFGCAVHTGILRETAGAQHTALSDPQLRTLGTYWYSETIGSLLRAYWKSASSDTFLPPTRQQQQALLDIHLIEKALLDIRPYFYSRRDLLAVPFRVILYLVNPESLQKLSAR